MAVMRQNRKNYILLGQDNNALIWLIIINAVIFVMVNFIKVCYFLSYETSIEALQNFRMQILDWFTLPASLSSLAVRPWTVLSYMFTHDNIWQLIGTLFWLWAFGNILQELAGNSKLIPLYIYGGLAGAVVFLLYSSIFPGISQSSGHPAFLIGGGSAVISLAIATTVLSPKYRLYPMINGGIPLWVLTLVFVVIDFATIASGSISYALAHFAGGVIGFLFVMQLRRGRDLGKWMHDALNWSNDLFNPEKKYRNKKLSQQNFYLATRKPFEKTPLITQQRLDEILDKINEDGYISLSDEEREFLKKASQQDM